MASQTGLSETQDVCPRMETLCDEVDQHVDQVTVHTSVGLSFPERKPTNKTNDINFECLDHTYRFFLSTHRKLIASLQCHLR